MGFKPLIRGLQGGYSQGGLPHFLALSWNTGRCKLQRAQGFCSPSVPGPYPPNLPVSLLSPTPSREMVRLVSALGSGHWILSLSFFPFPSLSNFPNFILMNTARVVSSQQ